MLVVSPYGQMAQDISSAGNATAQRGHGIIDPPFVPDQSGRDLRATRIALREPARERRTQQRQTIL
jgi:hypothetical protein